MIATKLRILGPAWTRTFRCLWLLEELKDRAAIASSTTTCQHEAHIFPGKVPREIVRSGKVPVLIVEQDKKPLTDTNDDSSTFILYESTAILMFLAERYDPSLLWNASATLEQKALFHQTLFTLMTELDATLWIHRKHESLGHVFGHIPEAVQHAKSQFHRMQQQLPLPQPYLCGNHFSIADIVYVHCLDWAFSIGWMKVNHTDHHQDNDKKKNSNSSLHDYMQRCHARPAYQRVDQIRQQELKTMRENSSKGKL